MARPRIIDGLSSCVDTGFQAARPPRGEDAVKQGSHVRSWGVAVSVLGLLGLVALIGAGCADRRGLPSDAGVERVKGAATPAALSETKPPDQVTYCDPIAAFNPKNFSHPLQIDNPWSPLTPGTQYALTGETVVGPGILPHEVVFTVSDVVKPIAGIETRVLWDRDFDNGALAESEIGRASCRERVWM